MKPKRWVIFFGVSCLLAATVARGADAVNVAGTWNMTFVKATRGKNKVLTLRQKGDTLEGTLKDEGGERPVKGKVTGNTIHIEAHKMVSIELDGTVDSENKDKMTGTFKLLTVQKNAKEMDGREAESQQVNTLHGSSVESHPLSSCAGRAFSLRPAYWLSVGSRGRAE